jgi:hypothetical protein
MANHHQQRKSMRYLTIPAISLLTAGLSAGGVRQSSG